MMKRMYQFAALVTVFALAALQMQAQEWVVFDGSMSPDSVYDWSGSGVLTDTILEDPELPGNHIYEYEVSGGTGTWLAPLDSPLGGITIVARIRANLDPSYQVVNFSLRNGEVRPDIRVEDDKLNPGGTSENLNHDIDMTEWHVIRMTLANDSSLYVYVDESDAPVMTDTGSNGTTDTYLQWGDGSGSDDYGGWIDWIIFDTTGVYAPGEGAPIPDSLRVLPAAVAGYWKLDEGTGTVVTDELGMSDGMLINPGDNIWVDGYMGKALDFTSVGALDTSAFVQIPGDEVDFTTAESFSFSVIAKLPADHGSEQSLISKGMPFVDNGGWYHLSYKDEAIRFMVWDSTTLTSPAGVMPAGFPQNDWVHIVCVKDAVQDSLLVYLNGERLDAVKDVTDGEISNDGDLYIGTVPSFGTDCQGALDEVMFFNQALTAEEIMQMAADAGFEPITDVAGHWKMDDGSGITVTDELGMSDGMLVNPGDNIWVDGYMGGALDFTSVGALDTSAFVHAPGDAVDFTTAESFSFSVIAKLPADHGSEQSLISKGMPFVDNGGWYHLSYKDEAIRFMVWDSTTLTSPAGVMPEGFPQMDWVHIVCVKDAEEDSLFVYLNGERLDAIKDVTDGEISNDGDLYIGTVPSFGTDCQGAIDEVKFFKRALPAEEIMQMASDAGFDPIAPAPAGQGGYWKFDEGSGTTVADEMGNHDGVIFNGGENIWVDGYIGKALDFTSKASEDTSAMVVIPGAAGDFDMTESFSFSIIAKLDINAAGEQSLISQGNPFVDNGGWWHLSYKEQAVRFMIWDETNLPSPAGVMPPGFPENDWVNIVAVRDADAGMLKVYVNGDKLDETVDNTTAEIATDGDLYIGTVPEFGTDVSGAIDEVQVFDRALTDAEIKTIATDYGFESIPTDVARLNTGSLVNVYPNPAKRILTIGDVEDALVSIYDLNGAEIRSFNSLERTLQIDVSGLDAGMYLLKVSRDDTIRVAKFIKE